MRSSWSSGSTARVSSGAKPYSSKVRGCGRARTARSSAAAAATPGNRRSAGLAHGSPRSGGPRPRVGRGPASRPSAWPPRAGTGCSRARGRWWSPGRGRAARRCRRPAAGSCRAGWRSIAGMLPPGRSVRPIEPAKSTSPERQISSAPAPPAPGSRNSTDPRVWPGAWSTVISSPASVDRAAVGQLGHVVRLGVGRRPPKSCRASQRRSSSAGRVGEQLPVVAGWM